MRLSIVKMAIVICGSLAAVMPASAACSNASFQGLYGYFHGRQGGNPPGTDMVVGQVNPDGKGLLSGTWTEAQSGGSIAKGTFLGRYSISANCSGTLIFNHEDNGNSPAHFSIILDDNNHGFQMIETDNGSAQPGFGFAQGTAACATGKAQTLSANLLGLNSSGNPENMVGQLKLNGKSISGVITISNDGTISKVSVVGSYTQQSSCLGTMQIKPTGFTTMNFNTVAVNGNTELLLIESDNGSYLAGTAQQ